MHVVQLPKGAPENSVTKNTNVYSARTIQVVNVMMYHLKNMGTQIKTIGLETSNEGLRVRLSNVACSSDPLQSVVDDMKYHVKYHVPCLVKAKRDIDQSKQPQSALLIFVSCYQTINCLTLLKLS